MIIQREVTKYSIQLFGGADGNADVIGAISLSIGDAGAVLRFVRQEVPVPVNTIVTLPTGKKHYYVNYSERQLAIVIDVLRNESPVWFLYNESTNAGYLTAREEPTGEGEG